MVPLHPRIHWAFFLLWGMTCFWLTMDHILLWGWVKFVRELTYPIVLQNGKNICCCLFSLLSLETDNLKLFFKFQYLYKQYQQRDVKQTNTRTHKFPDVVKGKNKRKLTLFASSSALCLAVLETDLSDNNRARRNSIVMLDSSMPAFFLVNTTNKEDDNNPNKILNPKFKIFKQVWHVQ